MLVRGVGFCVEESPLDCKSETRSSRYMEVSHRRMNHTILFVVTLLALTQAMEAVDASWMDIELAHKHAREGL